MHSVQNFAFVSLMSLSQFMYFCAYRNSWLLTFLSQTCWFWNFVDTLVQVFSCLILFLNLNFKLYYITINEKPISYNSSNEKNIIMMKCNCQKPKFLMKNEFICVLKKREWFWNRNRKNLLIRMCTQATSHTFLVTRISLLDNFN